jgi:hypothetical protein
VRGLTILVLLLDAKVRLFLKWSFLRVAGIVVVAGDNERREEKGARGWGEKIFVWGKRVFWRRGGLFDVWSDRSRVGFQCVVKFQPQPVLQNQMVDHVRQQPVRIKKFLYGCLVLWSNSWSNILVLELGFWWLVIIIVNL